ncbi:response regulator [Desulfovibrio sp. OttesenSCG-928-F20]|nr:response regulator [Desulfovibrio sp. OttesenSCG-928-M16]MDL2291335.1 response regulator [Desulfovibrio sp. OttesenSCG-928-F20]
MHILVVDDEREFLELMTNRLQKRGFTVDIAPTGEEALVLVEQGAYDAMVLDVKMPGIDGIEVLRRVKQIRPNLPVLLLTGHASIEAAMTGVETGAVDYLLKPVPINDLIMRLRDIAARQD